MAQKARSIGAETLRSVERCARFGETSESYERPRSTEVCVDELGAHAQELFVLGEHLPGIAAKQRQRRQAYSIIDARGVAFFACAVRSFGPRKVALLHTNDAERMPGARVLRVATHRFR